MEQHKIVIYCRFKEDVEQEYIDDIKDKMDAFVQMTNASVIRSVWEVIPNGYCSLKFGALLDNCIENGWSMLTYDLSTLHRYKSGALSVIDDAAHSGVPIFFVDSDSALKSIYTL